MKHCTQCGEQRSGDQFVKRAVANPDVCKVCRARNSRHKYNLATAGKRYPSYKRSVAAWKTKNPDKVKQYRDASYAKNPNAWKAAARKRDYAKKQRTPLWDRELTDFTFEQAIDLRDRRSEALGGTWEIDHILPLQGKLVSGLHVWNNIRVIPQAENRSKYNHYDVF